MTNWEGSGIDQSLQSVIDASMDGAAVLNESGTVRYLNEEFVDIHGYEDREAVLGKNWRRLCADETVERIESEVLPTLLEAGQWSGVATGHRHDGTTFPQRVTIRRMETGSIVWVARDVSDRRERAETLERYETVLQNIQDGVYLLDRNGTITWVNETAVRAFDAGYARDDLVGSPVSKILEPEDIDKCLDIIKTLLASDERTSGRCEIAIQTASGNEIPCDLRLTLLPLEDGEFQGSVGVVRDVTDRKQREQRISVMHRVLRHNLRNSMTVVAGQAKLLLDELDGERAEQARMILDQANDLIDLAEDARRLSDELGRSDHGQTTTDVAAIVQDRCEALRADYPDATITVDAPEEQRAVANETFGLAVDNLVENAIEHHDGDASVTVTVSPDGDAVTIAVADDSTGIPQDQIDVLTEDTETQLHHSKGLGLWIVAWLVESYGGDLSFETSSRGSVVRIRLRQSPER